MPKIKVICPSCSTSYQLEEALVGKKGRCKKCNNTFLIAPSLPAMASGNQATASARSTPSRPAMASANQATAPAIEAAMETRSRDVGEDASVWNPGDVVLGLYEVKQVHEGGGMGLVYRVRHRGWNLDLAVKSPRPEYFRNERDKENFEREAETWVKLGLHPHTVSCFYVRRLGGVPRVFAEYVEGGTLAEAIQEGHLYEGGPDKALARLLDLAVQFSWGLHYSHEQGLVHQDVKPGNVLLTREGVAKVTDFGLARARGGTAEASVEGGGQRSILVTSGGMTPAYCSPEQARGEKLTRKTDIWSWAASILEMFAGDVTWPAGQVAGEALEGYLEMGPAEERLPRMPQEVTELLRRCFQRETEARPRDMLEVATALQEAFQRATGAAFPREPPKAAEALADNLNNRAVSLLDLGKHDEAAELWKQSLQIDPHHAESAFNLGLTDWRAGRINDHVMVHKLKEVCATHSGDWLPAYLLAQVHWERGDCQATLQILETIQGDDARGSEVVAALGQARELAGQARQLLRTFEKEGGLILSVAFSPDNRTALAGGSMWKEHLQLWDLATGRMNRSFEGQESDVRSVCISRDGRYALSGGEAYDLCLWEVGTGRCLRTVQVAAKAIYATCLSPDNLHALVASYNEPLAWYELATGRVMRTFGKDSQATTASLSLDGRYALTGDTDRVPKLWDIESGQQVRKFEGHTGWIKSVALSSDCRLAISGSDDRAARLWDVATGACLHVLQGHAKDVNGAAFSPDGHFALTGSGDNTLKLWSTATGSCLRTFEGHKEEIFCVAISSDGRYGLSGSRDGSMRLWSLPWTGTAPMMISHIQVSEKAQAAKTVFDRLVVQGQDALAHGDAVEAARLLREARSQPGYARKPEIMEQWARLYLRLPRVSLRAAWQEQAFKGHKHSVNSLYPSPDSRFLLSAGGDDGTVRHWELATGKCLQSFKADTSVFAVAFSPDGKQAISGGLDDHVRIWDLATGQRLRECRGHTWRVWELDCTEDSRFILSAGGDKTLKLWELSTGRCLRTFKGHTDQIWSACLSSDDRQALSGSGDMTIKLWEVATGKCLKTFKGHEGNGTVSGVRLSHDGRFALSSSNDKTLKLWDLATGNCLRTIAAHNDYVTCVDLSADDRFAVSGSRDGEVKLWDLATGECVRTFEGHQDEVHSVFISPDGHYLGSGAGKNNYGGEIHIWVLDWELENRAPADWDEGARPLLEAFLYRHTPFAWALPSDPSPLEEEVTRALARSGKPTWTDEDFQRLLLRLGCAGFGYLRHEGVRDRLNRIAAGEKEPAQPVAGTQVASSPKKKGTMPRPVATVEAADSQPLPADRETPAEKPSSASAEALSEPTSPPKSRKRKTKSPQTGRAVVAVKAAKTRSWKDMQDIVFGAVCILLAIPWTVYLLWDKFTWWSLATGFMALAGFGLVNKGLETINKRASEIWIGTILLAGCSYWTFYLVHDGWNWWALLTVFMVLVGILMALGVPTKPAEATGVADLPIKPRKKTGGDNTNPMVALIQGSQGSGGDPVRGAGNAGRFLRRFTEGAPDDLAALMSFWGAENAREMGALLQKATDDMVDQAAAALLQQYRAVAGQPASAPVLAPQPEPPAPPPVLEPAPAQDSSNLLKNLAAVAQSPHLNETGRENMAKILKQVAENAKKKGR